METLGHYRIQDTLGEGAMGVVYRALDQRLDRTVALKVLRLHLNNTERSEYALRLQQEARSAARLNHAGIITVYDCGDENGHAYLAMEFVEGKTLQSLLDQGVRLPLNRVLKLADQLFAALAYAHEHDVVHRDIKPANLMLKADGRLKITDFGIAQLPASELTRTGTIVGSPRHMAPEQIEGKKLDGRADLFAAGIVLYEVLTGKRPFDGDHVASIAYKILHEAPADIHSLNPAVPDWLAQIVMRCLEKNPELRFANARDARNALRDAQLGKTDTFASTDIPEATASSGRPVRHLLIAAVVAGLALVSTGAWWFSQPRQTGTLTIAADSKISEAPGAVVEAAATAPSAAAPAPNSVVDSAPPAAGSSQAPVDDIEAAPPALADDSPASSQAAPATKASKPAAQPRSKPAKPTAAKARTAEAPPAASPTPSHSASKEAAPPAQEAPAQADKAESRNLWQRITGCDDKGNCPTPKKRETRDR